MIKNKNKLKNVLAICILAIIISFSFSFSNGNKIYSQDLLKAAIVDTVVTGTLAPIDAFNLIMQNKNNPDFIIFDVRTKAEIDSGYIEGSRNIDFNSGDFKKEIYNLDKGKTYLLYCKKGGRSKQAMDLMLELGFKKVFDIGKGFDGWVSESLPFVK
jgi:rhodanese-related sulfurtransferase